MKLKLLHETRPAGWQTQGKFNPKSSARLTDPGTLWQGTLPYLPPEHIGGQRGEPGKEAGEFPPFPYDPWSKMILQPESQIQSLLAYYKDKSLTFEEILDKLKPYLLKLSRAGYDMNYRQDYITALNGLIDKGIVSKDTSQRPSRFRIAHIDVKPTGATPEERKMSSRRRMSDTDRWWADILDKK